MNKKTMFTALLTGTLLTGIALSPAIAGRGFGNCDEPDSEQRQERMAERMKHRLEKMSTVLELTEVQQAQIKEIIAGQQENHKDQFQQRCEDRKQLQELKTAATFDEAAFRTRAEKQAAKRIDRQVERMKTKQQIFALLTSEQQEKAEIFFQAMDKRGPGHGHGMKH